MFSLTGVLWWLVESGSLQCVHTGVSPHLHTKAAEPERQSVKTQITNMAVCLPGCVCPKEVSSLIQNGNQSPQSREIASVHHLMCLLWTDSEWISTTYCVAKSSRLKTGSDATFSSLSQYKQIGVKHSSAVIISLIFSLSSDILNAHVKVHQWSIFYIFL